MSLRDMLAAFDAAFEERVPPAVVAAIRTANADLAASDPFRHALRAGDAAPDFVLPDAAGRPVALHRLAARGPVIVSFFRGGWCPYCSLELRAWQTACEQARHLGATILALSPQNPHRTRETIERNGLTYPVLSDTGSRVARAFGISFALAPTLRRFYARLGHVLPEINDSGDWELPIPGTYVVGTDRRLAVAIVDPVYQRRAEPEVILQHLRAMADTRPPPEGMP
jgi:peroxiredoxin